VLQNEFFSLPMTLSTTSDTGLPARDFSTAAADFDLATMSSTSVRLSGSCLGGACATWAVLGAFELCVELLGGSAQAPSARAKPAINMRVEIFICSSRKIDWPRWTTRANRERRFMSNCRRSATAPRGKTSERR